MPPSAHMFLFTPDISSLSAFTFSSKFGTEEALLTSRKLISTPNISVESLNQKLATIQPTYSGWVEDEKESLLDRMSPKK